jgi:hypothetical protein
MAVQKKVKQIDFDRALGTLKEQRTWDWIECIEHTAITAEEPVLVKLWAQRVKDFCPRKPSGSQKVK